MARVKDPVCGMIIDSAEAAATYVLDGVTYYFCSADERDTFAVNPSRYIDREVSIESATASDSARAPEDAPLERHEPGFTRKGFPAPKFGSAGSGGAEYERGPEKHEGKRD